MKNLLFTLAFIFVFSQNVLAQANRTNNQTIKANQKIIPVAKQAAPEGHYCSYCKNNYPESHFPCIMKAIKGKVDDAGRVSFTEGQPIGGIIVKGGRNPGGSMNITTNANGEVAFKVAELGNYKFNVTVPTSNPNAKEAGTPIGGIIVKGGKNPGGQLFTVVTNENGEIMLNNLSVGNYKFTVQSPAKGENIDRLSNLYKANSLNN